MPRRNRPNKRRGNKNTDSPQEQKNISNTNPASGTASTSVTTFNPNPGGEDSGSRGVGRGFKNKDCPQEQKNISNTNSEAGTSEEGGGVGEGEREVRGGDAGGHPKNEGVTQEQSNISNRNPVFGTSFTSAAAMESTSASGIASMSEAAMSLTIAKIAATAAASWVEIDSFKEKSHLRKRSSSAPGRTYFVSVAKEAPSTIAAIVSKSAAEKPHMPTAVMVSTPATEKVPTPTNAKSEAVKKSKPSPGKGHLTTPPRGTTPVKKEGLTPTAEKTRGVKKSKPSPGKGHLVTPPRGTTAESKKAPTPTSSKGAIPKVKQTPPNTPSPGKPILSLEKQIRNKRIKELTPKYTTKNMFGIFGWQPPLPPLQMYQNQVSAEEYAKAMLYNLEININHLPIPKICEGLMWAPEEMLDIPRHDLYLYEELSMVTEALMQRKLVVPNPKERDFRRPLGSYFYVNYQDDLNLMRLVSHYCDVARTGMNFMFYASTLIYTGRPLKLLKTLRNNFKFDFGITYK